MGREDFTPITQYADVIATSGYGGTTDRTYYYRYKSYDHSGFRQSSSTPGFHNPRRVGKLLPNNFTFKEKKHWWMTGYQRQASIGYLYGTSKPGNTDNYHSEWSGPNANSSMLIYGAADTVAPSDLDGACRNDLLNKIKDQKANLPELWAERSKTADMVGKTAMTFVEMMRHLRRGDLVGAARAGGFQAGGRAASRYGKQFAKDGSRAVANGWLALQYGWKPLVSDIYGSLEVLADKYELPAYHTVKSRKKRKTNWAQYNSSRKNSGITTVDTYSGDKRTAIQYSVTFYKSASPANTLNRLGVTNPALLAWELLPYSFVVDWFLPVGNFLSTMDATMDVQFYCGYKTLYSKSLCHMERTVNGLSTSNIYENTRWTEMIEDVWVERTVLPSFPSPAFPSFKDPSSIEHMLNALALLSQLFRK